MARRVIKADPRLPIIIDKQTWMYAEPRGLNVVREIYERDGGYSRTEMFYLPWSKVKRALEIREIKPKPKSKRNAR